MSRWWRAYDECVDDPKLQRLGPALAWSWFNLMCIVSKNGGVLPEIGDVAFMLRTTEQRAAATITALVQAELFERRADGRFEPHNWNARQFKSDADPSNADRQQRYRDRKKERNAGRNADGNRYGDRYGNDQRQSRDRAETDSGAKAPAAGAAPVKILEPVDEDAKAKLFRIAKTILVSFGVAEKRTGALIGQWLKIRPDPSGLLAAIQYARDQNVAEPVAYISTLVNGNGNGHKQQQQSLGDVARELAEQARNLERKAGLFGSDDPVRGY